MKKSFIILCINSLLLSSSSVVLAMDNEPNEATNSAQTAVKKALPPLSLGNALQIFENEEVGASSSHFTTLYEAGSLSVIEYLQQTQQNPLVGGFESTKAQERSKSFYKASSAYKNYKKSGKAEDLLTLANYVLGKNAHALHLIKKLYEENNNILTIIKNNKKFKSIKTINDLSKNFQFTWDCLDIDNVRAFYPHQQTLDFKTFEKNCSKAPHLVGHIALEIAKRHPTQLFWSYLAIENGKKEGLSLFVSSLSNLLTSPLSTMLVNDEELGMACYYISQLQKHGTDKEMYQMALSRMHDHISKSPSSTIFQHLKSIADLGHIPAQTEYAQRLVMGQGMPKNLQAARKYLKLAADWGDPNAQYNYAYMCAIGDGGAKDPTEALTYYQKAAYQGHEKAHFNYAQLCQEQKKGVVDVKKARHNDKILADQGASLAQYTYAVACLKGEGGIKDPKEARKYFKLAADQGLEVAQHNYALMCFQGKGGVQDLNESLKYCKKAADKGFAEAQRGYAQMCIKGEGTKKNLPEARKYYKMAADQGSANAQYNYAEICTTGEGGKKDLKEARTYYKKAADQGMIEAQYNYAYMCLKGEGGVQNLTDAFEYNKKAADQGNRVGQNNYACMNYKGEGGAKNFKEALNYFKKAADQGYPEAQNNYAYMRYRGEGDVPDIDEALKYLKRAADQGLTAALIFHDSIIKSLFTVSLPSQPQETASGQEKKPEVTSFPATVETETSDNEEITITFSDAEEEEAASEEDETTDTMGQPIVSEEPQFTSSSFSTLNSSTSSSSSEEDQKIQEENDKYTQENQQRNVSLRAKKEAQKAQKSTSHTLTLSKAAYKKLAANPIFSPQMAKADVAYETFEFVKSIFSKKGSKKINFYTDKDAQQAFGDLGCKVNNKDGENTTHYSFTTEEGWTINFTSHNHHGGSKDLHKDDKKYMRKFLTSINKTPDTLQVR